MLNIIRSYDLLNFKQDLMAGITVTAVALPLALAFGVSSGATAAAGLITAILAGVVIGALSGGSFQISGPTGAMSAILVVYKPYKDARKATKVKEENYMWRVFTTIIRFNVTMKTE